MTFKHGVSSNRSRFLFLPLFSCFLSLYFSLFSSSIFSLVLCNGFIGLKPEQRLNDRRYFNLSRWLVNLSSIPVQVSINIKGDDLVPIYISDSRFCLQVLVGL
ncbi:hypothetical protein GGR54DRAFT_502373 [Hypoxylon sp. NC1633]|nr:hypothetical protein GGR54DRAFT_502373 [Hypoxylon sp. NC1633]